MANRLKFFRVKNAKTQTEAARAAGVTQPTYQRWETGKAPIPESYLKKLAKFFKTTGPELLGRHPPKEAAFYDDEAPLDLQYYGECAVHFVGGGDPLVLSISEAAFQQADSQLGTDKRFIVIKDLGNRTVAIRQNAIAEFYFSSEAYDTYGPDHKSYTLGTLVQMPDTRDWQIVDAIRVEAMGAGANDLLETFSREDVERVAKEIGITEEQLKPLIEPITKESKLVPFSPRTEEILELAARVTIRLSTGKQRDIDYVDCNLFEVIEPLEDTFYDSSSGNSDELHMIELPYEGYHRTVHLNPDALDYISFPTHQIEQDETESYADGLTEPEGEGGKVIKLPKAKKKG